MLCLFLVLFVRRFRVWQTLAGAIFGFSKRWLAPFSGLEKANVDSKVNEKCNVL